VRVSRRWLDEFLPEPLPLSDLLRLFPSLGFDVDSVTPLGPGFSGVVVGRVLDVQKHPNADRLSLCRVSDGARERSVVCGAPNVAAGQVVAFAPPGARLPGGWTLEPARIRGVDSEGMICSASELGLGLESDGILVLEEGARPGTDAASLLGEADDALEVDVTANRPDCLSLFGLAREICVRLGCPPKLPELPGIAEDPSSKSRPVEIEVPSLCGRYVGRELLGLRVGSSPGWLSRRLEAVGARPVNALVDATNYVLFELGHPLHAFDSKKLRGEGLRVRRARPGESLSALDSRTYALGEGDLVIADSSGPVAIAGVMGGEPTGCTANTTSCFLESAHFDPGSIRRTSRRLGLRSESSYRFERGCDAEAAEAASLRAAGLILKLCGGRAAAPFEAYPGRAEPAPICVSAGKINAVLGTSLEPTRIEPILRGISSRVDPAGGGWRIVFASWRKDLACAEDVAEEVARHLGYEVIGSEPSPVRLSVPAIPPAAEAASKLRARLEALGFFEAVNVDLVSESSLPWREDARAVPVAVENPVASDQSFLRASLWPGLLVNARFNLSRGCAGLRLYEIGRVYSLAPEGSVAERTLLSGLLIGEGLRRAHWRSKRDPADLFDAKGAAEDLLESLGLPALAGEIPAGQSIFHPKACIAYAPGMAGLLDPRLLSAFDLSDLPAAGFTLDLGALCAEPASPREARSPSPFPSVSRDVSLTFQDIVSYREVESCLRSTREPGLSDVGLIDVYQGAGIDPGRRSLTLRLTFSHPDRTLTDAEAEGALRSLTAELAAKLGARPRG
jgi:phenylalanyl-tRNA synthetase beta chain